MTHADAFMQFIHHTGALITTNANKGKVSISMTKQLVINHSVLSRISFYPFMGSLEVIRQSNSAGKE